MLETAGSGGGQLAAIVQVHRGPNKPHSRTACAGFLAPEQCLSRRGQSGSEEARRTRS